MQQDVPADEWPEPLVTHEMRVRNLRDMAAILLLQAKHLRDGAEANENMACNLLHYSEIWRDDPWGSPNS